MKALFTMVALFFSGLVLATPLHNIVVFGDSLSDNGNLYEHMDHKLPQSPPYYEGRFSNGPVWVEHLAASYFPTNPKAHLLDYAFGGAGVSEEKDEVLFTLNREIDIYLNSHQDKADENSLFIVWIGANNYLGIPVDVEKTLTEVNAGIVHALQRLVEKGAKHILILNLPDLGQTPIAANFEAKKALSYFSNQHNELLLNTVEQLKQDNPVVQWLYFDVHKRLSDLLESPEFYGFNNIKDTCYDVIIKKSTQKSISHIVVDYMKSSMQDDICGGYLFFDPIHPTAPAHKIVAENAKTLLDAAGIEFETIPVG